MHDIIIAPNPSGQYVNWVLSENLGFVEIWRNNLLQSPFSDYSRSGVNVAFFTASAPSSTDSMRAAGE
jgi:hypothetical protein